MWKCPDCGVQLQDPKYPIRCCKNIAYEDGRVERITLTDEQIAEANQAGDYIVGILIPAMDGPGVGAEMDELFKLLGVDDQGCGSCRRLKGEMNLWGPEGCKENRVEIIKRLKAKYRESKLRIKLRAFRRAATSGLALKISWRDPLGSLLDEAIERAESKQPI